jgi:hypothetical protein
MSWADWAIFGLACVVGVVIAVAVIRIVSAP